MSHFQDEPYSKAAASGAVGGALTGGAASLFDKSIKNWRGVLINALIGAGAGAGIAGGSMYVGSKAMGSPPSPDEKTPYATRGALGGAIGGGALGAGLGGLASSGIFKVPEGLPHIVRSALLRMQKMPVKRGAGLGALALGTGAAAMGLDEGMQLDFIQKQLEDTRRKQFLNDMYGGQ